MLLCPPKFWALLTLVIFSFGCQQDDLPEEPYYIGTRPRVRVIEFSPDTVRNLQDSMSVTFFLSDTEGDVGSNEADYPSIFVLDDRLESSNPYWLPPLSDSLGETIEKTIEIKLKPFFIIEDTAQIEMTTLSIQAIDQVGNRSNSDEFGPIYIIRE